MPHRKEVWQPSLHDLLVAVPGTNPGVVRPRWPDPANRCAGGRTHADVPGASAAVVTVDGVEPEPVLASELGAGPRWPSAWSASSTTAAPIRRSGSSGAGRSLQVRLTESLLAVERRNDDDHRHGAGRPWGRPRRHPGGQVGRGGRPGAGASRGSPGSRGTARRSTSTSRATGAVSDLADATRPGLSWSIELKPNQQVELTWGLRVRDRGAVVDAPPPTADGWGAVSVVADDRRLAPLVAASISDLAGLRLAEPGQAGFGYLAAGAPWYLTLFGRDSLWAARMLLPLGTELAASTLRTLAARQGVRVDPSTGEEPGKILHELRRVAFGLDGRARRRATMTLPPVYYGTVDATPLWIALLHDAWCWGMPAELVVPLLPHLDAALSWMSDYGDADGDGLLEYVDTTGHGLANQGWKDSGDSVQWRDGRLASAPIALAEVQAYAYEAAMSTAPACSTHSAVPAQTAGAVGPMRSPRGSAKRSGSTTATAAIRPSRSTPTSAQSTA